MKTPPVPLSVQASSCCQQTLIWNQSQSIRSAGKLSTLITICPSQPGAATSPHSRRSTRQSFKTKFSEWKNFCQFPKSWKVLVWQQQQQERLEGGKFCDAGERRVGTLLGLTTRTKTRTRTRTVPGRWHYWPVWPLCSMPPPGSPLQISGYLEIFRIFILELSRKVDCYKKIENLKFRLFVHSRTFDICFSGRIEPREGAGESK